MLRRAALALCFALAVSAAACGGDDNNNPNNPSTPPPQGPPNLVIEDLTVGTGADAAAGQIYDVNYALYTYDPNGSGSRGVLLQSSSFSFRQGANQTIPGFDQGFAGMKIGGIRRLTVPPTLAYGANPPVGSGIQANAWIVFDVQLVNARDN